MITLAGQWSPAWMCVASLLWLGVYRLAPQTVDAPTASVARLNSNRFKRATLSGVRAFITQHGVALGFLCLYAIVLAFLNIHHEIYVDEAQAWQIARNSQSLMELFHHLRYEGHPALWYLLLYIPSHLSSNPQWMQAINYTLSVGLAWLVLSEHRIPIGARVLLIFSVTILIYMGDVARSYTLAAVLLVGAARCLLSGRKHWLAMVLIGLAVNAHFLAIPVAVSIFVWFYWLRPDGHTASTWATALSRQKERRFWISVAMLSLSLALCYATLRPAPDLATPHYNFAHATRLDYLISGVGSVWRYFAPNVPEAATSMRGPLAGVGTGATPLDACITLSLWLFALSLLPTRRSRWFMFTLSILWIFAVWNTVHLPSQFHSSHLFIGYTIALMLSEAEGKDRPWIPVHYADLLLLVLLGLQVSTAMIDSVYEIRYDFSGAKATAEFLLRSGLTQRPLIIQPDGAAPPVLAYTGVASAYYPDCQCRGPFIVFRRGREVGRHITASELEAQRREFEAAPVVIANSSFSEAERNALGLRLIYESPHGWFWDHEDLSVYDTSIPSGQTAAVK